MLFDIFGRFDTSGSTIPLLVPEISPCDGFYDKRLDVREEELDILVVGYARSKKLEITKKTSRQ